MFRPLFFHYQGETIVQNSCLTCVIKTNKIHFSFLIYFTNLFSTRFESGGINCMRCIYSNCLLMMNSYSNRNMQRIGFFWRDSPQWARASSFKRFLDHTQRRTTVDRTPLDKGSARRRDLYLTTHNTHNRQTSMPQWESNPEFQQASGRRPTPQTARPLGQEENRLLKYIKKENCIFLVFIKQVYHDAS